MQYPSTQKVFEQCQNINENETFLDLWWDNFLQAMAWVAHCSLQQLDVELYTWAIFKRGLKVQSKPMLWFFTTVEENQPSGENHNYKYSRSPIADKGLKGGYMNLLTKDALNLVRVDD